MIVPGKCLGEHDKESEICPKCIWVSLCKALLEGRTKGLATEHQCPTGLVETKKKLRTSQDRREKLRDLLSQKELPEDYEEIPGSEMESFATDMQTILEKCHMVMPESFVEIVGQTPLLSSKSKEVVRTILEDTQRATEVRGR